jgi:glycosyltransferase involved in cell wall biosynthesis
MTAIRRVHFFHPYFRDGGVERSVTILAREFARHGVETAVITFGGSEAVRTGAAAGLRFVDLPTRRAAGSLLPLARHLRAERPDVLISFQSYANVTAVTANALAGRPVRVMVSERSAISRERGAYAHVLGKGRLKNALLLNLMRIAYRAADWATANSADGARDLETVLGFPPGFVRVLYNPTFEPGLLTAARAPLDHPFYSAGAPVIVSAGRLSAEKDHATLVRAFARVRATRPCRLVLVGEGPERERLLALAHALGVDADISLTGFEANPWRYVAASHVFVLSSLWEGLPNALIEAVALDVPCVSTACISGPREILLDGRGGTLVPPQDDVAMARAIEAVLADPESARARARIARTGLSRFASEDAAAAYLKTMETP